MNCSLCRCNGARIAAIRAHHISAWSIQLEVGWALVSLAVVDWVLHQGRDLDEP